MDTAESDKSTDIGQYVQREIVYATQNTVMSAHKGASANDEPLWRLLALYQEKERLSEELDRLASHIRKDESDITKLQLLAARYMKAAQQRTKMLAGLREQENGCRVRFCELKDEIRQAES